VLLNDFATNLMMPDIELKMDGNLSKDAKLELLFIGKIEEVVSTFTLRNSDHLQRIKLKEM
jgi:hypothetical protein